MLKPPRFSRLLSGLLLVLLGVGAWLVVSAESGTETQFCQLPQEADVLDGQVLPSTGFGLVSWNIAKGSEKGWQEDLAALADGQDLLLLQEAVIHDGMEEVIPRAHTAFAPGYSTTQYQSGVMTLSRASILGECAFSSIEPYLRSPKRSLITAFAIKNSDETLLVANIHAVNFTLGLADFSEQLQSVMEALRQHRGPLILAGDFNTWRQGRQAVLDEVAAELGLSPIHFQPDHRRRAFGYPLDHVYQRGLRVLAKDNPASAASDHTPLRVRLALQTAASEALK